MGNASSSGAAGLAPRVETYHSVLRSMRDNERSTVQYGGKVRSTLTRAAEAAVDALPERERTVRDVQEAVRGLHEWLAILGPLCHSCTVASLAKRAADTERWTDASLRAYLRDYALGACGFVGVDGSWTVDDRVLARLASSLSMWKALSGSSVARAVATSPQSASANVKASADASASASATRALTRS